MMEELAQENAQLKQMARRYRDEIQQLRQKGSQHENQIETLLKFNEKLLTIIEKQLNNRNNKSNDALSLHAISEKTQIQSNMYESQVTNQMANSQLGVHNIKSPILQSKNTQSMANIEREEQLSIAISHEGEKELNRQGQNQQNQSISSLLHNYHQEFQPSSLEFPKTTKEIEFHISQQMIEFQQLKSQNHRFFQSSQQRLHRLRQKYCGVDPKYELCQMIDSLEASHRAKERLKSYLERD